MCSDVVYKWQHLNHVSLKVNQSNEKVKELKWMSHATNKINCLRRDLVHRDLIIKCKAFNSFTNNQNDVLKRLKKKFGKSTNIDLQPELVEAWAKSVRLNYLRKLMKENATRQVTSKPIRLKKFRPRKKRSPTGTTYWEKSKI